MPAINRSFYTDMHQGADYWTFISEELPQLVQSFFKVSDDRNKTLIAGLSMGGYGAFKLALTHPDRYAAAASLSGALDINSSSREGVAMKKEEYETVFGSLDQIVGSNHDLLALLDQFPTAKKTAFYQCCGQEDFLYEDNQTFLKHAQAKGLDLTYEEHPDHMHNWIYWDQQIQRVLEWSMGVMERRNNGTME